MRSAVTVALTVALCLVSTTLADSDNLAPFVNVKLQLAQTWTDLRQSLRNNICSPTVCNGYRGYGGPTMDMYLAPTAQTSGTEFTVYMNQTWMVYQALGLPTSVLTKIRVTSISAGKLAAIEDRGDNLVTVTTKRDSSVWTTFEYMTSMMYDVIDGTNYPFKDFDLVSLECNKKSTPSVNDCTWVFGMKSVSQQVEIAGIDWASADKFLTEKTYITSQSLYPANVDLDKTTASKMGNRVAFDFVFTPISNQRHYRTYEDFLTYLRYSTEHVEPRSVNVWSDKSNLVKCKVVVNKGGSAHEQFTISFTDSKVSEKLLSMYKDKKLTMDHVKFNSVKGAASPSGSGDGDGDGAGKKSHAAVIAGVIVALVVSGGVVAYVLRRNRSRVNAAPSSKDMDYQHMNSNQQV